MTTAKLWGRLFISIEPKQKALVDRVARSMNISTAELVRTIITKYMLGHGYIEKEDQANVANKT